MDQSTHPPEFEGHRRLTRIPGYFGVAVAAVVTIVPGTWAGLVGAAIWATAAALLVDTVLRRVVSDEGRAPAGPWLGLYAGSVVVAATSVAGRTASSLGLLIGASVLTATALWLMQSRMRERAGDLAAEAAISTGGIAALISILVVEPRIAGSERSGEVAISLAVLAVLSIAVICLLFLFAIDRESRGVPTIAMLISILAAATVAATDMLSALGTDIPSGANYAAAVGVVAAAVAALHPRRLSHQLPGSSLPKAVQPWRVIVALSTTIIGPALLGIDMVADIGVSEPLTAIVSGLLALAVGFYFFRLVRRFGVMEDQLGIDLLTGLPNQLLLHERINLALANARPVGRLVSVMFLDLDRFKMVNDSLGHDAGDRLLRLVANRICGAVEGLEASPTVARIGGDEFAVVVPAMRRPIESAQVADLIISAFRVPFEVNGQTVYIAPSIGIAHYPDDGTSAKELLENADSAMYRAKENGRNRYERYTADSRSRAMFRLDLSSALHRALELEEFELAYQPQVQIPSEQIVAVEALVRWRHPELGLIAPGIFLPALAENGLMEPFGRWVLHKACRDATEWEFDGADPVRIAVNIATSQLLAGDFENTVIDALRRSRLDPKRLELEITTATVDERSPQALHELANIRQSGVRVVIDDFVVANAGLDYLDRLEIDGVKIDRKFVARISHSTDSLVRGIIALASELDLAVVAEGVETTEQRDFLHASGCGVMQGYLFSAAVSSDKITRALRTQAESPLVTPAHELLPHGS